MLSLSLCEKDKQMWLHGHIHIHAHTHNYTSIRFQMKNAQTFAQRQNTNEFHSHHHLAPYLRQKMKMNYATGPKVIYLSAIKQMRIHSNSKSHSLFSLALGSLMFPNTRGHKMIQWDKNAHVCNALHRGDDYPQNLCYHFILTLNISMLHLTRNISCLPPELCLASLSTLHHVLTCGARTIDSKNLKLIDIGESQPWD